MKLGQMKMHPNDKKERIIFPCHKFFAPTVPDNVRLRPSIVNPAKMSV